MEEFRATNYERIADTYDTHRAHWDIPRDEVLEGLARQRAVTALDVGCGTGLYFANQREHLAGLPIRWIGIDPSSAMLRQARAKATGAILVHGQAEALPFVDRSVDYVHASYTFHQFTDKEAALNEMCRILRPDGSVRIVNVEPRSMPGWWVYEFFPETVELDHRRFWSVERLTEGLTARGLEVESRIERTERSLQLDDVLAEAESRTISQHAAMDDDAYARGLERLRAFVGRHRGEAIARESAILRLTARTP